MKDSGIDITDLFCGAGGSSTGAVMAHPGVQVRMAVNHWKLAIETHNTNHPNTDHDCVDVSQCDPRRYPTTRILWASPSCTNHSLAKGARRNGLAQRDLFNGSQIDPAEERSRATMWDVPRFAEYHRYDICIVENVIDARRWVMWPAWLQAMHLLGYEHQVVYLNSMFAHPTPQSRDRLYVVFHRKGVRRPDLEIRPRAVCARCGEIGAVQVWRDTPQARERWGKYRQQYDYACPTCWQVVEPYYYPAATIIDWTIQAQRIGDRDKPLAPKTLERIRYGLDRYGRRPAIITGRYTSGVECRVKPADTDPMPTQPADLSHGLLTPPVAFLSKQFSGLHAPIHMDEPTDSITTVDHHALVADPIMVELFGRSKARPASEPLGAVTAGGINYGLLVETAYSHAPESRAYPLNRPMNTQSARNTMGFLTYFYSNNIASGMDEPVGTVTTRDRAGFVGPAPAVDDCTFRMLRAHEIQSAMAFPSDYVVLGNQRDQVKQLGNAVTPPAAREIISRCVEALAA